MLEEYFNKDQQYGRSPAELENELDEIAEGKVEKNDLKSLRSFEAATEAVTRRSVTSSSPSKSPTPYCGCMMVVARTLWGSFYAPTPRMPQTQSRS